MINRLIEKPNDSVEVQETTFALDVLGRYICSTWEEATNNGGRAFDAIVIGAGMFGAYCAEKIYRRGNVRVLVLEAGSFLVSEHVQNLARIGLNTAGAVKVPSNDKDPGTRERVWGNPWRSQVGFPGLAYCVGGKSLYWGGWSPRLTDADFANWPADIVEFLKGAPNTLGKVEREIGTSETTDYISGPLYQALRTKFDAAVASGIPNIDKVEEAPLAVQGTAPASGLFSFDKYSSAPILIDAVREAADSPDSTRRLFLVPRANVSKLHTNGAAVTQIEVFVNGQQKFFDISPQCAVVLASSTIEATRLALLSFPTALMGRNLMGHLRSNTVVRIKRSVLPSTLPKQLEAAALLVRGSTPQSRYHLQVTAAAIVGANSEATMFRMVPDIELLDRMLASQSEEWIVITLRGIGEMQGDKNASTLNAGTSWMDLSFDQNDQFGRRRAWVNLVATPADETLWNVMDNAALALALKLADNNPANLQYFYNKTGSLNQPGAAWHNEPPPPSTSHNRDDPANKVRDGLGTTHHESGPLWMGTDSTKSVTDLNGRFHHVTNAYVASPALFPTIGSANPTVTGLALARRTASAIVRELVPVLEPGFQLLFDGSLADWKMSGAGKFIILGKTLESDGGIGVLWYAKEQFSDFILRIDWRATSLTDNSGVYLRFPALPDGDPNWLTDADSGWEVQIDERGFDSSTNTEGNDLQWTGAIYKRSPALTKSASRPIGEWNTFEIEAIGPDVGVKLNGIPVSSLISDTSRPTTGHIGLQNHHTGSRVQFGNIRIKKL